MTHRVRAVLVFVALTAAFARPASAQHGTPANSSANRLTIAVFGDWPYSQAILDAAPTLIHSINSDPKVRLIIHVGDIHSGSMPCTGAGLTPLPAMANPGWNMGIYDLFQQFEDPFIYTPGDNEWSDCHKTKEKSSGAPLNELAAVRSLFFSSPGYSLGEHEKHVVSQAEAFDPAHPDDAQFVENVMWEESRVVFVTLNVPGGSNDDTVQWTAPFTDDAAQAEEVATRDAANLRWLAEAFAVAERDGAAGVVVALQADMWDPEALPANGGTGLDHYTPLVTELAGLSLEFGRPVLLLNGDSHMFRVDYPLADPSDANGMIHDTAAVPNLTRIVVQGSADFSPWEWLKLTIDPKDPGVFSWENVVYGP